MLRIFTYNIGVLPHFPLVHADNHNAQRLRALADFLLNRGAYAVSEPKPRAAYDFVFLQEVFGWTNERSVHAFCDELRAGGYTNVLDYRQARVRGSLVRASSGLLFATRHKIVRWRFEAFRSSTLSTSDTFAAKGVLGVLVETQDGRRGWLFNTHMQADVRVAEENEDTRAEQLRQIRAFIRTCLRAATRVDFLVLAGDLNIDRADAEYSRSLSSVLGGMLLDVYARFVPDASARRKTVHQLVRDGTELRTPMTLATVPRSVDYLLLSRDSHVRVRSVRIMDLLNKNTHSDASNQCSFGRHLSDHAAMEMEMTPL